MISSVSKVVIVVNVMFLLVICMVLKMLVVMFVCCIGIMLIDSLFIKFYGKVVFVLISISNGIYCDGDGCDVWCDNRYRLEV